MTTLTATDRATVAKLLGLVGSHHDSEALAAARKAHQLVTRNGSTWPEILGLEHVEPEPEPTPPAPPHIALARELLGRGKSVITNWERNFLIGIMAFKSLKPKQIETLEAVAAKINAATQSAA